jgi:outer membrane murein-binding lipoprotein Lpp
MENKLAGETKNNKKRAFPMMLLGAIALVIIIVANVIVWRSYLDMQAQVEALKTEVQQVNEQVAQAAAPPSGLESKLEIAKGELANALQVFPGNIDKNDIVDFILNTAQECQVQIVPLVAEGVGTGSDGQSSNTLKYHGTVTGSLSRVSSFMTKLHNGKYPTMIITECTVQRVTVQDNSISDNDIAVTVDFDITLYASSIKGN